MEEENGGVGFNFSQVCIIFIFIVIAVVMCTLGPGQKQPYTAALALCKHAQRQHANVLLNIQLFLPSLTDHQY